MVSCSRFQAVGFEEKIILVGSIPVIVRVMFGDLYRSLGMCERASSEQMSPISWPNYLIGFQSWRACYYLGFFQMVGSLHCLMSFTHRHRKAGEIGGLIELIVNLPRYSPQLQYSNKAHLVNFVGPFSSLLDLFLFLVQLSVSTHQTPFCFNSSNACFRTFQTSQALHARPKSICSSFIK